jgi:hypothetical protein
MPSQPDGSICAAVAPDATLPATEPAIEVSKDRDELSADVKA